MAVNPIGVDPKNLRFDFNPEWASFRDGRIRKFLSCWLEMRIARLQLALENVKPEDLLKVQGGIAELKVARDLVNCPFANEPLKEVITFLEKKS